MKLERLISQEPFNKWVGNFLREYRNCNHAFMEKIGNHGASDMAVVDMFLQVMLKKKDSGFISREAAYQMFMAWYNLNSTYHMGFGLSKQVFTSILESRYPMARYKGEWGFSGIEFVVDTPEEALELINEWGSQLEYRLPNFYPEVEHRPPPQLDGDVDDDR